MFHRTFLRTAFPMTVCMLITMGSLPGYSSAIAARAPYASIRHRSLRFRQKRFPPQADCFPFTSGLCHGNFTRLPVIFTFGMPISFVGTVRLTLPGHTIRAFLDRGIKLAEWLYRRVMKFLRGCCLCGRRPRKEAVRLSFVAPP